MTQFKKHFTVREAQELLPGVQALLRRIHNLLSQPILIEMEEMRPVRPASERARSMVIEGPAAPDLPIDQLPLPRTVEGRHEEADKILRSMVERGILIQDVRRGLIDFPHMLYGEREVLLCYELADGDEIGWYHDLHAGFSGRQPIPLDAE
ncbi:DUF2203 domain-containing protein [bacterium]|nr:DUF2203 domain-containing protein [bacterium]